MALDLIISRTVCSGIFMPQTFLELLSIGLRRSPSRSVGKDAGGSFQSATRLASPERALRSLIVQMKCDGERTGWCPASDFFGRGAGRNGVGNWYRTVDPDSTMACRWVVPYEKSARVTLVNLAGQAIKVSLCATVGPRTRDSHSMHFHAVWHHGAELKTSPARDWNFVTLTGRVCGRYPRAVQSCGHLVWR